jgi:hypothetical protein
MLRGLPGRLARLSEHCTAALVRAYKWQKASDLRVSEYIRRENPGLGPWVLSYGTYVRGPYSTLEALVEEREKSGGYPLRLLRPPSG